MRIVNIKVGQDIADWQRAEAAGVKIARWHYTRPTDRWPWCLIRVWHGVDDGTDKTSLAVSTNAGTLGRRVCVNMRQLDCRALKSGDAAQHLIDQRAAS